MFEKIFSAFDQRSPEEKYAAQKKRILKQLFGRGADYAEKIGIDPNQVRYNRGEEVARDVAGNILGWVTLAGLAATVIATLPVFGVALTGFLATVASFGWAGFFGGLAIAAGSGLLTQYIEKDCEKHNQQFLNQYREDMIKYREKQLQQQGYAGEESRIGDHMGVVGAGVGEVFNVATSPEIFVFDWLSDGQMGDDAAAMVLAGLALAAVAAVGIGLYHSAIKGLSCSFFTPAFPKIHKIDLPHEVNVRNTRKLSRLRVKTPAAATAAPAPAPEVAVEKTAGAAANANAAPLLRRPQARP